MSPHPGVCVRHDDKPVLKVFNLLNSLVLKSVGSVVLSDRTEWETGLCFSLQITAVSEWVSVTVFAGRLWPLSLIQIRTRMLQLCCFALSPVPHFTDNRSLISVQSASYQSNRSVQSISVPFTAGLTHIQMAYIYLSSNTVLRI